MAPLLNYNLVYSCNLSHMLSENVQMNLRFGVPDRRLVHRNGYLISQKIFLVRVCTDACQRIQFPAMPLFSHREIRWC